jgi:hypothetical protein
MLNYVHFPVITFASNFRLCPNKLQVTSFFHCVKHSARAWEVLKVMSTQASARFDAIASARYACPTQGMTHRLTDFHDMLVYHLWLKFQQ